MMPLAEYADWVSREVLSPSPHERIRDDWIPKWSRTLKAVQGAQGIFELVSIICARWEFLGSLYLGTTQNTSSEEAVEYVSRFLSPLNHNYRMIHNISGQRTTGSEFFSMLRNQPLHGYTPAAISVHGGRQVVAWWIGSDEQAQEYHLQIRNGVMHVDANKFLSEFLASLDRFRIYLVQDQDIIDGRTPSDRWRRGFWARFKPKYMERDTWMQEGYERGIPT
jgi:hypothetical protein